LISPTSSLVRSICIKGVQKELIATNEEKNVPTLKNIDAEGIDENHPHVS
jgi:hypothetical protein